MPAKLQRPSFMGRAIAADRPLLRRKIFQRSTRPRLGAIRHTRAVSVNAVTARLRRAALTAGHAPLHFSLQFERGEILPDDEVTVEAASNAGSDGGKGF